MMQAPATRDAPAFEAVYALVRDNLDPGAGDIPVDRLMQVFRRLADLYDTDVSSPLNMGYFCIDADAASIAAMDETNRRGANIVVRGQHPASAAFEQYAVDLIMATFGIDPESGAGHFTACGTEANQTAMIVALTDRLSHRNPRCTAYDQALCYRRGRARGALRVLAPRRAAAHGAAGALRLAPDPLLHREERAQPDRHRLDSHGARGRRPPHGRGCARRRDGGGRRIGGVPAVHGRRLGRRDAVRDRRSARRDRRGVPRARGMVPPRRAVGRHRGFLASTARGLPRRARCRGFAHLRPAQDACAARRRRVRHVPLPPP